MLHQDLIIFQKPHFLPSSTNPIPCNDKSQSRIPSASRSRQNVSRLPTFLLSNVRSLKAKIDELQVVTQQNHIDVIAVTETLLNPEIPDGPVSLTDYSMVRKDRASGKRGGVVCAFIKSNITFSTLTDLSIPEIECLWLKLRPYRLPRELSCIFVGVIYHPPSADNTFLQDYLIASIDKLLSKFANAGIMLMGDFNHFNYRPLCRHCSLKQTVKQPTRGSAILDLMLSNMYKWYKEPEILPAIGLSDHQSILITPTCQLKQPNNINKKSIRKVTSSKLRSLGNFITSLDWTSLYRLSSCQDKYDLFHNLLMLGLDTFLPKKKIKIHCRDKPWITPELKRLISDRQKALAEGDRDLFKQLRITINRAIKHAKVSYFETQVNQFKTADPTKWWKAVKNLAGYTPDKNVYSVIIGDRILDGTDLANAINEAFVDVNKLMPPISDLDKVADELPCELYIPVASVERGLEKVKPIKASGPDSIPNWLLKRFSMKLATPVASIFNASISQALVPLQWKVADVIPIPKTNPIEDLNNDFRPISLTATLSKILESFYADWILDSIYHKLDPRQFGALAGSSSIDALISCSTLYMPTPMGMERPFVSSCLISARHLIE